MLLRAIISYYYKFFQVQHSMSLSFPKQLGSDDLVLVKLPNIDWRSDPLIPIKQLFGHD